MPTRVRRRPATIGCRPNRNRRKRFATGIVGSVLVRGDRTTPHYVAGRWRFHFDFHGGGILEWGSHTVDLCQWAAGKDNTAPIEYIPERGWRRMHLRRRIETGHAQRRMDGNGNVQCALRRRGRLDRNRGQRQFYSQSRIAADAAIGVQPSWHRPDDAHS